ncbi:MAG TPA: glycosyltransferase family 2 protein [Blastocatellia bacterium]|nr:glycosyltransferase family 2 protein [Blastocatellia bacterium]
MKPLVSILIPAYNAQEWIADALCSAMEQQWDRTEIIVVDDGSRDHTLSVARRFQSTRVCVVTQENQGAAAARNHCLELSQGDYIQWLDADDLLGHEKILRQMEAVSDGAGQRFLLSGEWAPFFYRPNRARFNPTPLWCDLSPVEWLYRKMQMNLHMQTATWLVSRALTELAGPWQSLKVDDDGEYFCRMLTMSDGVRFVPGAKVYYRQPGCGSLSHIGYSDAKKADQWRSMLAHIGYLRSLEDSERVREACVTYIQNWLLTFYPERSDLLSEAYTVIDSLGGRMEEPRLSWKYSWIQKLFGWDLAKRAKSVLPAAKWVAVRYWDQTMFRFESRAFAGRASHI